MLSIVQSTAHYLKACAGVNLSCGSHSKQRLRKSINSGSSQFFSACDQSRLPGGPRSFPRCERPNQIKAYLYYLEKKLNINVTYRPVKQWFHQVMLLLYNISVVLLS